MVINGGSPGARELGAELRALRNATGRSVRELANELGIAYGTISRWERGERVPQVESVARLLGALGASHDDFERVIELARHAPQENLLLPGIPGVHKELRTLLQYERTATGIFCAAPLLIPGLLQTGAYARALMPAIGISESEIENRVGIRLGRRELLTKRSPVELDVVVGETALRSVIGGRTVAADQLAHILAMAELPNVTVRVDPIGPSAVLPPVGAFLLLSFKTQGPIVHLEHYRAPLYLYSGPDVRDYVELCPRLRAGAMSPARSLDFIAEMLGELEDLDDE
ncbi:helix-turn-helix domain-containing protein [Actinoalloteichus hymeniacidonis]|uniref:Transcriptional regulator n=1 Tax=Actinoalloteichus hymeniacidonis TaxID=340345 RepID=A0AAC9HN23_9PSEU|nr:helix-turn-helix transcriptional regulator [Actinoalloteichus hymeniacidonis]AOS61746.1 putative transcriptional regulator [Actinoalloteichus hymeniacidonis]MBB5910236.1 transcriptional regulator with XRE-family HTH domain [Actinoalloteichus hymeniacidonis]